MSHSAYGSHPNSAAAAAAATADANSSNARAAWSQGPLASPDAASLGMLDQGGGIMGGGGGGMGLDMNLLPMDLDDMGMDLSAAAAASDPAFSADPSCFSPAMPMPNTSQAQDPRMASASGGGLGVDGFGGMQSAQQQLSAQQQQQQDGSAAQKSQPGAGPPPLALPPGSTHTTLTEFTKRRNWSQRIIEELRDFLHILTPDGRILYASPSCRAITGHDPQSLVGRLIGEYVHPDDTGIFMREFNESIASGNTLRFFYRFKKDDGTYIILECDGHPHISPKDPPPTQSTYGQSPIQQNQVLGVCRGFFMMARPYPTKNAALLDSFLEHKIENERLLKRIDELKREEATETAEQDRLYREHINATPLNGASSSSSPVPSQPQQGGQHPSSASPAQGTSATDYQGMPPPAKPTISNTALTRQNLDSALSSQRPDSMADKMSRYEANAGHLESIELLTGLRYRDGERSHGISTGDTSPALIRGDAGIAILLDRDRDAAAKKDKKKLKVADEYVCADCGTLDSPEWRKGPKGPKTLCNACGLRWAKKEKKRDDGKSPHQGGQGGQGGGTPGQAGQPQGVPQGQPNFGGMGHLGPPGMPKGESTGSS